MSKIEIWKCDHCGKEEKEQGSMRHLCLIILNDVHLNLSIYNFQKKCLMIRLWCEKCIIKNGMGTRYYTIQTEEEAKNNPRPTFEEKLGILLKDCIIDEVQEQLSDQ